MVISISSYPLFFLLLTAA